MLVKITSKCYENCTHCMDNATHIGTHMRPSTLRQILKFLKPIRPRVIQISGGEPTLHPEFIFVTRRFLSEFPSSLIIVESNGTFYRNSELYGKISDLLKQTDQKRLQFQIRTHPDYYPSHDVIFNNPLLKVLKNTTIFNDGIVLFPLGRATQFPSDRKYPLCINAYLLSRQEPIKNFTELIHRLNAIGKFCHPMIDPDGYIHAGESLLCHAIQHVSAPSLSILHHFRYDMLCNRCNLLGSAREVLNQKGSVGIL